MCKVSLSYVLLQYSCVLECVITACGHSNHGLECVIPACGHGNCANPVVSRAKFDAHTHCHCQVIRVPCIRGGY